MTHELDEPPPEGLDSIADVAGLSIGHYTDPRRPTGCTVMLTPQGAVAGVDVRGAAPGTRETDLLAPVNTVDRVHALLLAGGSAFGLDAAGGVMRWLEERHVGFAVGTGTTVTRVPIVPAAILFDLVTGDPSIRPDATAGYAACQAASSEAPAEGNVGAGAGCTVGKLFGIERAMKGGIGSASVRLHGITVGAIVAVNAVGDVVDPETGLVVAGARDVSGRERLGSVQALLRGERPAFLSPAANTTIGIVATDAVLGKVEATQLARIGHDGLARSIHPVHTASDGDLLFGLSTGTSGLRLHPTMLGVMAAEAVARAVLRAVRAARGIAVANGPVFPSAFDMDSP